MKLVLTGLAAIGFAFWMAGAASKPSGPYNLLLVTIDTLRADHLGAYGSREVQTPHLDRLASEGVRFERALSHVPLTLPSHASLLTGMLPTTHGVRDNGGFVLREDVETLAEKLREEGYRTGAFVGAFVLDSKWGIAQGFHTYHDDFEHTRAEEEGLADIQRSGAEVENLASQWIRQAAGSPFFAWVHFYDPHDPYVPPEPFRTLYSESPYAGEVAYTDTLVGRLLKTLEETNLQEKTIVAITSDHGEGLGEHREMTHGVFLYDTTLHVPLLFKGPGIPRGSVASTVGLVDVFPTLLEVLGLAPSSGIDGRSLVSRMRGDERDDEAPPVYAESHYAKLHYGWSPLAAVVADGFKYIRAPHPEVFDMENDPKESRNLVEAQAARARRMEALLENWTAGAADATADVVDAETRAKLQALGYAGTAPTRSARALDVDPKEKIHLIHEFFEALSSYRGGDFPEAARRLDDILEEDPELLDALFLRGVLAMKARDHAAAKAAFERALDLKPDHTMVVFNQGLLQRQMGRQEEAMRAFERALELDPSQVKAAFHLAQIHQERGDSELARQYYQRAIDFHTSRLSTGTRSRSLAEIHDGLSIVYFSNGDFQRAETEIRRALELAPDLKFGHYNLAQILERQGRIDDAAEEYGREIERVPDNLKARQNLGLIWRSKGEWAKAVEQFRAAAEGDPRNAVAAFLTAECMFRQGIDLQEARRWAEKSVEVNPTFQRGLLLLAEIYRRLGRESEAREIYLRATGK